MATPPKLWLCLLLMASLPTFASCNRPFKVTKKLFVQETSPFALPEGARVIRRIRHEPELESHQELEKDPRGRFRRDTPFAPYRYRGPERSIQSLAHGFDTLHIYWPRNSDKYVFLLAKMLPWRHHQPVSKVYLSKNYGMNFTDLKVMLKNGKAALIDQTYSSATDPKLCILADKRNKVLFRSEDLETFQPTPVRFEPSYITFHPSDDQYSMAYDTSTEKLYWSNDRGKTFTRIQGKVKSFHWGVEGVHNPDTIFVEKYRPDRDITKNAKTSVYQLNNGQIVRGPLAVNVDKFQIMKNYMFITTPKNPTAKSLILKVAKIVKDQPIDFKEAQFPLNEKSRDFFVFDVDEDYVFLVINQRHNASNLYVSDASGVKYQLSLRRVWYKNPFTDVKSPWLRTLTPYAFVGVQRIKGMRGIFIAAQLSPGPVGKRRLLYLITYNRGGKWQRVRSPTVSYGRRINCYLPSCSLHLLLQFGNAYRVSPSNGLFSSESAPGLVLGLGQTTTNLKSVIPDLYLSLDGGLGWRRVLRGKYLFTFGEHGGVIIAVPYRRYTRHLRYSINGGSTWVAYSFSRFSFLARDIVSQPGERLPIFLIYGTGIGWRRTWIVFYLNMTSVLGPVCDSSGYTNWTDGCLLGRQQQFETRNWTIRCRMGRDYKRAVDVRNCPCRRDDYQCEYGFQRKALDEECTPILQGVDLDHHIIPENCPEGTNYLRTRGFRKIPGDTCVNGTQEHFSPVSTPCPVKELVGLILTCVNLNEDGIAAIASGESASFKATVQEGYYPNIRFKWFYGDRHVEKGTGMKFASRQHQYDRPGKYIVFVVASNTRNSLVATLELNVQESPVLSSKPPVKQEVFDG